MPLENDYLIRLIKQIVDFIAKAMRLGGAEQDASEIEAACRTWTGLDLDTAELLATPALVSLFAGDPMSAEKALLLGLGLGLRAITARRAGDLQRDVRLSQKAIALIQLGLRERPDLDSPDIQEVVARVMGQPATG